MYRCKGDWSQAPATGILHHSLDSFYFTKKSPRSRLGGERLQRHQSRKKRRRQMSSLLQLTTSWKPALVCFSLCHLDLRISNTIQCTHGRLHLASKVQILPSSWKSYRKTVDLSHSHERWALKYRISDGDVAVATVSRVQHSRWSAP